MRPSEIGQTVSRGKIKSYYAADKLTVMNWATGYNRKGFQINIGQTANGWWCAWVDTSKKR